MTDSFIRYTKINANNLQPSLLLEGSWLSNQVKHIENILKRDVPGDRSDKEEELINSPNKELDEENEDFGLNTSTEEEYDAFSKETFGGDISDSNWEDSHEELVSKFAALASSNFSRENECSDEVGCKSNEDDEEYDALNNETFGDDIYDWDWKENHERLAVLEESSRRQSTEENGGQTPNKLFNIDCGLLENNRPITRPPPGFISNGSISENGFNGSSNFLHLKNLCTVEEIERKLIKHPPNTLRLEDLERKLISSVPSVSPLNMGLNIGGRFSQQQQMLFDSFGNIHPIHRTEGVGTIRRPMPSQRMAPADPYAGLMSAEEKSWLASIQLMALNFAQPLIDDYYYIMYQYRKSGRKITPFKGKPEHNITHKTYVPIQHENSLGTLQVGSVIAPRKLLDKELVETIQNTKLTPTTTNITSSSKRKKQLLLEIEQMYVDLLKAEDGLSSTSPYAFQSKSLFTRVVLFLTTNDKLNSVMNIRKGKVLVLRVLSHVELALPLAHVLLSLMPNVAMKDTDQSLLQALPSIRHCLHKYRPDQIESLAEKLTPHLAVLLPDKFGVSLVANILEQGHACNLQSKTWFKFIGQLGCSPSIERPVVGIPSSVLSSLISRAQPPLPQHNVVKLKLSLALFNI